MTDREAIRQASILVTVLLTDGIITETDAEILRQALEQPEYEFELQNYVLCDRCNQIVNKEFERLQQEQFFYKQTQNVPSASNGEDRNE